MGTCLGLEAKPEETKHSRGTSSPWEASWHQTFGDHSVIQQLLMTRCTKWHKDSKTVSSTEENTVQYMRQMLIQLTFALQVSQFVLDTLGGPAQQTIRDLFVWGNKLSEGFTLWQEFEVWEHDPREEVRNNFSVYRSTITDTIYWALVMD